MRGPRSASPRSVRRAAAIPRPHLPDAHPQSSPAWAPRPPVFPNARASAGAVPPSGESRVLDRWRGACALAREGRPVAAARRGRGGKANRRGWSATIADMDELRCIFCDQTESQAGRLYKHTPRPVRTPRAPPLICAECSESINFVVRTNLVREGRLFEAEAEFPPIASHRFPLRGPDDEEA